MKHHPRILSVSWYGAGLADATQHSGALARQRDYAASVERYVVVVPGKVASNREHGGGLFVLTLQARGHLAFGIRMLRAARALQREHRFSIVQVDNPHIGGLYGLLIARLLCLPLVVHSMADMPYNPWYRRECLLNIIKDLLARFVIAHAALVRVSTEHEVDRLERVGVPRERIIRVPFYIDTALFPSPVSRKVPGKHVLVIARLAKQKDIGTLLAGFARACKEHPDARLTIVGTGPEERYLKERAVALGITPQVTFRGAVPYNEIPPLLESADIFALSSLYEGTCMALHEAALAHLPLVATAFAGAVDFIRDGREGFIVPVRDSEAFGRALTNLLSSPETRMRMADAATVRLASFSREEALRAWDVFCTRMAAMYSDAVTSA